MARRYTTLLITGLLALSILAAGGQVKAKLIPALQAKANAALLGLWPDPKDSGDGPPRLAEVTVAQLEATLKLGADVNAKDANERTTLVKAAQAGNILCVKVLVSSGALVNAKDKWGVTALDLACFMGKLDCVDFLISKGANVNETDNSALINAAGGLWASDAESSGCVRALVSKGADVNASGKDGDTALIEAASEGKVGCVKFLVAKGADVNARDKSGKTAFSDAQGHPDILVILKTAGAK